MIANLITGGMVFLCGILIGRMAMRNEDIAKAKHMRDSFENGDLSKWMGADLVLQVISGIREWNQK